MVAHFHRNTHLAGEHRASLTIIDRSLFSEFAVLMDNPDPQNEE
jgi:hypothetical protein